MSCVQKLSNIKMDKHINKINMASHIYFLTEQSTFFLVCYLFLY